MSPEEDRAKAISRVNRTFGEVTYSCISCSERADRETDRQTNTLITILRSAAVGGVIIRKKRVASRHPAQ